MKSKFVSSSEVTKIATSLPTLQVACSLFGAGPPDAGVKRGESGMRSGDPHRGHTNGENYPGRTGQGGNWPVVFHEDDDFRALLTWIIGVGSFFRSFLTRSAASPQGQVDPGPRRPAVDPRRRPQRPPGP